MLDDTFIVLSCASDKVFRSVVCSYNRKVGINQKPLVSVELIFVVINLSGTSRRLVNRNFCRAPCSRYFVGIPLAYPQWVEHGGNAYCLRKRDLWFTFSPLLCG